MINILVIWGLVIIIFMYTFYLLKKRDDHFMLYKTAEKVGKENAEANQYNFEKLTQARRELTGLRLESNCCISCGRKADGEYCRPCSALIQEEWHNKIY